jgi:hypothetical protein
MTSHLNIAEAQALSSLLTQDPANVEPLIRLIVGMTEPDGDPKRMAVRTELLKSLYDKTKHSRSGFEDYMRNLDLAKIISFAS